MTLECHTALIRGWGVRRLASRKIRGPSASLVMTQDASDRKRTVSGMAASPFCDCTFHFSLGAGSPLPRKCETHEGFHIGLSDLPFVPALILSALASAGSGRGHVEFSSRD